MPRECDAVEVLERKGGAHAPTTPNTPRLADRRRAHLSPATLVQAAYVGGHFAVECLGEPMELMWADMRPSLRAMMPRQAQASALALSFPLKAAGIPNSEALTLILLGALVRVPSRGPVAHAAPTSHRPRHTHSRRRSPASEGARSTRSRWRCSGFAARAAATARAACRAGARASRAAAAATAAGGASSRRTTAG